MRESGGKPVRPAERAHGKSRSLNTNAPVALGYCLLVVGSNGGVGLWKYRLQAAAIAVFVVVLVLSQGLV